MTFYVYKFNYDPLSNKLISIHPVFFMLPFFSDYLIVNCTNQ